MADIRQGELATDEQGIIIEARERFQWAVEAEGRNRAEYEFDRRFVNGEQWDPNLQDERFSDRRPCLTVNMTDSTCRRIINACRENRPRIVTHPVSDGASIETAKIYDGLIRHIEAASTADTVYDQAMEQQVHGGWSYIGVDADYISDKSFDQELKIVGWSNPLECYMDPNSRAVDGSDMEFFLETRKYKRAEYRKKFGKIDTEGWKLSGQGDGDADWSNKEEIRVMKYWRIERKTDTLRMLSDGGTVLESQMDKKRLSALGLEVMDSPKRTVYVKEVWCYLLTATQILSRTKWAGKFIPRVPVYGRRLDLNGRIFLKGLVRDLRDPARMFNYARTKATEHYAMVPGAQWVGPAGFMEGKEAAWRDSNRKAIVGLEYTPVKADDGELLPPPQRMDPPQVNQGFGEWAAHTKTDFLALAGMPHDPNMDMKGEVVSGVALQKREGIADVQNFDFYDNFCRSLKMIGAIIIDLIPHYYDTKRVIRIVEADGTPTSTTINDTAVAGKILNDVTTGCYEVVVDTGPSYATKRQESAEMLIQLLTTPLGEMVAHAAGDQIVRQLDFADAQSVADRLAALIPAAQQEVMKDLPPQAQAMVASLQGQIKQMQQQLQMHQAEAQVKLQLEQMKQEGEDRRTALELHTRREDVQMRERVAAQDRQVDAATSVHDTQLKAKTAIDVAKIGAYSRMHDSAADRAYDAHEAHQSRLHEAATQGREHAFGASADVYGRRSDSQESERDRQHTAREAERGRQHTSQEAERTRQHTSAESAEDRKAAKAKPPAGKR